MAQDSAGNTYVAADILRAGPPATLTVVVAKVDPNNQTIYRFTFAQTGNSYPTAIAVDAQGNVLLTGFTDAADFPLVNSISSAPATAFHGFLAKLDALGSKLLFSTLLGERLDAVTLDAAGSVYVTGLGAANSIPDVPGSYHAPASSGGVGNPIFVAKFTSRLDAFVYAATLGNGNPSGIAITANGSATVAGSTADASYPVTPGVFQPTCGCAGQRRVVNGFVSRLSADGTSLVWSTFLGGTNTLSDQLNRVAIARDGGIVVAGIAASADFPTTAGAFQSLHLSGRADIVIAKLNTAGSALMYSSRFGGSYDEIVTGLALDLQGRAWVSGGTSGVQPAPPVSGDFPTLPGTPALGRSLVAALETDGSRLIRTELLPDGVAVAMVLNSAGDEMLFGAEGSLLRIPAGTISGIGVLGIGNAMPQQATGYTISGDVAPGEIVSIYGVGLGPAAGAQAAVDGNGRIPTALAGTRVLFDGIPAPLLYAASNQINAVVPFAVSDKPATVVEIQTPSGSSSSTVLRVVAADPAISAVFDPFFGAYLSVVLNQDGSTNSLSNRAAPGQIVTFWVNGGGSFQQPLTDGSIVQSEHIGPLLPISARLSGTQELPAEILYAGTAPGMIAGLMQMNVRVPPDAGPGSYSALELRIGDFVTYASVAVK